MSKTNCINCGAAKDTDALKCPFCGTTYLDMTAIDFSSNEPVVCQFVMPYTQERVVLSMLAVPSLNKIEQTCDTVNIYGDYNSQPLAIFKSNVNMDVDISFRAVPWKDNPYPQSRHE